MGEDAWRMYCVHWNTRKARLARKSRADNSPATGRSWKPVLSETAHTVWVRCRALGLCHCFLHWELKGCTNLPAHTGNSTCSSETWVHQPNLPAPTGNTTCSSGAQRDHLTTGLPFSHSLLCLAAVPTTWAPICPLWTMHRATSSPPKSQLVHSFWVQLPICSCPNSQTLNLGSLGSYPPFRKRETSSS